MFLNRKKSINQNVKDNLYADLQKLVEAARIEMFSVDGVYRQEEADEWGMRFEANFMEQLIMYIVHRDHRIAKTYFERGKNER